MMKQYTFAVVGALGNVGTEMRSILETSDLPIENLVLLDIAQNAGTKVKWRGEEYTVAARLKKAETVYAFLRVRSGTGN